jgi:hypothetical protein
MDRFISIASAPVRFFFSNYTNKSSILGSENVPLALTAGNNRPTFLTFLVILRNVVPAHQQG